LGKHLGILNMASDTMNGDSEESLTWNRVSPAWAEAFFFVLFIFESDRGESFSSKSELKVALLTRNAFDPPSSCLSVPLEINIMISWLR